MEPNTINTNEGQENQVLEPVLEKNPKKNILIIIAGIIFVILVVGGYFAYQKIYRPYKEKQKQELIKQQELQKYKDISARILSGDIENLTREDYLFYLNRDIDYIKYSTKDSLTTLKIGGFNLSFEDNNSDSINVFGPNILFGEGYIILDQVKTVDGEEDLSQNGFEDQDKDIFHDISNYEKVETSLGIYYRGNRDLHTDTDFKDMTQIVGKIVLPFYDKNESIIINSDDKEKLIKSGKLSEINFVDGEVNLIYSGELDLIDVIGYDENDKDYTFRSKFISNDNISLSFGEEKIVKVKLTFGLKAKDIEIPFTWDLKSLENNQIISDANKDAVVESSIPPEDEIISIPVTSKEEILKLQKTIGNFTALFHKNDLAGIKAYSKVAGFYDEDDYTGKTEAEIKEEMKLLSNSMFKVTEEDLFKMENVKYEKSEENSVVTWIVSNIPAKDPIFEQSSKITFFIKEIDGQLYVIDFTM